LPGIGPRLGRQLLQVSGGIDYIWRMRPSALQGAEGIGPKVLQAMAHANTSTQAEEIASQCRRSGIGILCPEDDDYPDRLKPLEDAPLVIFTHGETGCLGHTPMLAVVGARRASREGKLVARRWSRYLSQHSICIISGMAFGIDAAAHRGCLEGGAPTIAVLGCGLASASDERIQRQISAIAEQGCVISEFLPNTMPRPEHFPRRNRIIAGLSQATLVAEAGLKSGALITANQAASYGRDVLAVPGTVLNGQHAGCHRLIKDGAMLVESAEDILTAMCWRQSDVTHKSTFSYTPATENEAHIIEFLRHDIMHIDALAERCDLTVPELSPILIGLELAGIVACLPGSRYALAAEE